MEKDVLCCYEPQRAQGIKVTPMVVPAARERACPVILSHSSKPSFKSSKHPQKGGHMSRTSPVQGGTWGRAVGQPPHTA